MAKPTEKTFAHMIDPCLIEPGETVRKGMPVKWHTGNTIAETTDPDAIGIALQAGDGDNPMTKWCRVHRLGAGIVPVLCSDTIAIGADVGPATDGVAAVTVGGGDTLGQSLGTLVDAGVAGGLAGCDVGNSSKVVTA